MFLFGRIYRSVIITGTTTVNGVNCYIWQDSVTGDQGRAHMNTTEPRIHGWGTITGFWEEVQAPVDHVTLNIS